MRTSAFFGTKNFGIYEIFGVSARTRGRAVKPVRTKGEGFNFSRFCANVIYGRPHTQKAVINSIAG